MTFEQEAIEYMQQLCNDGVILTGGIRILEEPTAVAVASFIVGDVVKEKHIMIIKDTEGEWSWKFFSPADYNDLEFREGEWSYPRFEKRIVAPVELIMDDIGIKMYGWFQVNNLPIRTVNETTVHLYCNVILPEHQDIVDALGGVITIEDRPEGIL